MKFKIFNPVIFWKIVYGLKNSKYVERFNLKKEDVIIFDESLIHSNLNNLWINLIVRLEI